MAYTKNNPHFYTIFRFRQIISACDTPRRQTQMIQVQCAHTNQHTPKGETCPHTAFKPRFGQKTSCRMRIDCTVWIVSR